MEGTHAWRQPSVRLRADRRPWALARPDSLSHRKGEERADNQACVQKEHKQRASCRPVQRLDGRWRADKTTVHSHPLERAKRRMVRAGAALARAYRLAWHGQALQRPRGWGQSRSERGRAAPRTELSAADGRPASDRASEKHARGRGAGYERRRRHTRVRAVRPGMHDELATRHLHRQR